MSPSLRFDSVGFFIFDGCRWNYLGCRESPTLSVISIEVLLNREREIVALIE